MLSLIGVVMNNLFDTAKDVNRTKQKLFCHFSLYNKRHQTELNLVIFI